MHPPVARTDAVRPYPFRRLYRDADNGVVAGVAAGLAEHLGVATVIVRMVLVVMGANGLGALVYVAFWAVLPVARPGQRPEARAGPMQRLGLVVMAIGALLLLANLDGFAGSAFVVLLALVALGFGVIWHQAAPRHRRRSTVVGYEAVGHKTEGPPVTARAMPSVDAFADRRWFLVRMVGGSLLVVVGVIGILGLFAPETTDTLGATLTGLLFGLLALTGVVLALAPLLYRMFGQLREERVARIREQERAEVAAVVHDQVLHTLALIQRHAADATSVLRLARGQERTLRTWLYKPASSPVDSFAAALEQVAAEVEDAYAITVETVVVGDADHDDRVAALVAATREALVNAARHAKVDTVSLYAEAEEDRLSVFIRDRGSGFHISDVDGDRHGVRGSIIGRMSRHGGMADVRSAPGEGTEVMLVLPRARQPREPATRDGQPSRPTATRTSTADTAEKE